AARGLVLRRDRPRHAGRAVSSPRPLERGDHAARHPVSGHGGALGRGRGRSRARERPRLGRNPARERGARERRRGERGPLPLERRPRAADGALTPPAPRAMPQASLAFVLHAHLPFVRHPAHEDFLEERWLAEAITETYIPLLEVLGALERDRVPTRLTLSVSPPLLAMLAEHRRSFPPRPQGHCDRQCGYQPGLLAELGRVGVLYVFVGAHGVGHATPRPVYGVYARIACDSGVAAFGRVPDSSKQVWSAEE